MGTYYGLSETEYLLMQFIWESNHPLSFFEIFYYCNETLNLNWAQTTAHTYLTRLIQKGVLASDRKGYKKLYYAKLTEQELSHEYANRFVEESYHGSIRNLLASLTYETSLSPEEVEDLKQLLDSSIIKNTEN